VIGEDEIEKVTLNRRWTPRLPPLARSSTLMESAPRAALDVGVRVGAVVVEGIAGFATGDGDGVLDVHVVRDGFLAGRVVLDDDVSRGRRVRPPMT